MSQHCLTEAENELFGQRKEGEENKNGNQKQIAPQMVRERWRVEKYLAHSIQICITFMNACCELIGINDFCIKFSLDLD